jgi:hypothetical protein
MASTVRQIEVQRALRGAKKEGYEPRGIQICPDRTIYIWFNTEAPASVENSVWDEWEGRRGSH